MKRKKEKFLYYMLGAVISVSLPWSAWAGTTVIENTVNASASTGGNSVGSGGKVIQGESKAQVKIYTEIDGEVVTDIDETVTAPIGENAVIDLPAEASAQAGKNVEKKNFLVTFLNKIFKYVFSIF